MPNFQRVLVPANDPSLGTQIGNRTSDSIVLGEHREGLALFGGYRRMPPGLYRAIIWLDINHAVEGGGFVEVCGDSSNHTIKRERFNATCVSKFYPFIDIQFELFKETPDVEIRLLVDAGTLLAIDSVEILANDTSVFPTVKRAPIWQPATGHRRLNILYYSCHEILEYDELRMLTNHGHRVMSLGAFHNPKTENAMRPPLPQFFHPGDAERYAREGLSRAFAEEFDITIVMHMPERVGEILSLRPDMPVIYRSIGQSLPETEAKLAPFAEKIKIVRYSERERNLPGFLPTDEVIYFGKNLEDFNKPWVGGDKVLTFHNRYPTRTDLSVPGISIYQSLAERFPCVLYGAGNTGIAGALGTATYAEQLELYRTSALYLYVYTVGPSYTLSFMEAMGSGLPILAPSSKLVMETAEKLPAGINLLFDGPDRYEIEELLGNDRHLIYDSADDAAEKVEWLLANPSYLKSASNVLRRRFAAIFDERKQIKKWDALMYSML